MLSSILSYFVAHLVSTVVGAIIGWLGKVVHGMMRDKKIADQAKSDVQPLKDANTAQEVDDAAKDALNHL